MTKAEEIKALNSIVESAQNLAEVARQCMAQAARLESTAKTRLTELGNTVGRRRKVQHLSDESRIQLLGSLTKGKPNA